MNGVFVSDARDSPQVGLAGAGGILTHIHIHMCNANYYGKTVP
jgi:hypothetical protein